MKYLLNICLVFSVTGCSSLVEVDTPKFVNIERVEIDQDSYEKPQFYLDDFQFSQSSRSIASAYPIDGNETENNLSNRELYFLTFYKQFKTLGKILKIEESLNSCPSFHNVVLSNEQLLSRYEDAYSTEINLSSVKGKLDSVTKYPILAIPYSGSTDLFSVLLKNDFDQTTTHVKEALEYYYVSQKREIEALCDQGVSPGYYIFENLVSFFRNDQSFHKTKDGLKALLKVPVISNMIILDNLLKKDQNYFTLSSTKFEYKLMQRSNVSWFQEYRENLRQKRRDYIGSRVPAGDKL